MSTPRPEGPIRRCLAPRYPGRGKCPFTGFLCGFVFGAIGVGIFLWSVVDGLAVLVIAVISVLVLPAESVFSVFALCGLWCAARAVWDTHRYETDMARGNGAEPEPAPVHHGRPQAIQSNAHNSQTRQHAAHARPSAHN